MSRPIRSWLFAIACAAGATPGPASAEASDTPPAADAPAVSDAYRAMWDAPEVRDRIERGIREHRMADAVLSLPKARPGTEVRVEQTAHAFLFGGNIMSEITVPEPVPGEAGREIQAALAANWYRLWFSHPAVDSITWWNVADGGAAPGEPGVSGLLDREMRPKAVYHALDALVNRAWKTRLTLKYEAGKPLSFRGFKGRYRVTWTDTEGTERSVAFDLRKNGDGL